MPTKGQAFLELIKRGALSPEEIDRYKQEAAAELTRREKEKASQSVSELGEGLAIPEATMPLSGKEEIKGVVRAGMPYIRPTLEFGGLTAGGIAGATVGPMGSVGGAGLGYAMGSEAADLLEEWSAPKPVPLASPMEARLAPTPSRKPLPATLEEALPKAEERFATGATLEMGGQVAGKLVEMYGVPTAKKLSAAVQRGVEKTIGRYFRLKQTASQSKFYYDRAKQGILEIIANKNNLKLTDVDGNPVSGLPKTLAQWGQAIEQTKRMVYKTYNSMAKAAGREGLRVDVAPTIKKLEEMSKDKVLQDFAPNVAKYAARRARELTNRGVKEAEKMVQDIIAEGFGVASSDAALAGIGKPATRAAYTAEEAEKAIAFTNKKIKIWLEKPDLNKAANAYVDSLIVNNLRRDLDKGIMNLTGREYQALKDAYGALAHVERDVMRRAAVATGAAPKGFFDMTDVFTTYEAIRAITSLEPSTLTAAAGARWYKTWIKKLNDPNRIVKGMFQAAEQLLMKKTVPAKAKTTEFAGKVAGYTVEKIRETK